MIPALKRLAGGSVSVKAKDTNIIKFNTALNNLIVDLQNIEMVKEIFDAFRDLGVLNIIGEERQGQSILNQLKVMKGLAESLNEAKVTIRIRRMGETVLVIGEQAKPRLSRLVLGNNIQADILKITSLMRDITS
jgi:hypothetical protein